MGVWGETNAGCRGESKLEREEKSLSPDALPRTPTKRKRDEKYLCRVQVVIYSDFIRLSKRHHLNYSGIKSSILLFTNHNLQKYYF